MSWQKKLKTLSDYSHKYEIAPSGCWEWLGHINKGGYGVTVFGSRIDGSRKQWLAHRLFYYLAKGSFDTTLKVCHHCDNCKCVNPNHLFLGTQKDNMQDCARKGRIVNNPRTKLTLDQVKDIRHQLGCGVFQKDIAGQYGVNQTLISAIKVGRIWI